VRFVGVEAAVMLDDGAADGERSRGDARLGEEEDAEVRIVIREGQTGEMRVAREPVPETPPELEQIIKELK
jgi:hypothetical protein